MLARLVVGEYEYCGRYYRGETASTPKHTSSKFPLPPVVSYRLPLSTTRLIILPNYYPQGFFLHEGLKRGQKPPINPEAEAMLKQFIKADLKLSKVGC